MLNETHDANTRSWVESANLPDTDFPIQNLPFCVFRSAPDSARIGVGIGRYVLDLQACTTRGLTKAVSPEILSALQQSSLNEFMALGRGQWQATREYFFQLLKDDSELGESAQQHQAEILHAIDDIELELPMQIGDFTDYECSHHHAVRMRRIMSGSKTPLANGFYLPRAYHGRSSSVVVSGSPVYLPSGQIEVETDVPEYKLSEKFDYELEIGIIIGSGNDRGKPIAIDDAEDHIFGFCLVNDWSARDIQKWERFPLGPFLGKNHATTMSPWVVTMEALAPFRAPQTEPGDEFPEPFAYLDSERNRATGGLNISVDVFLSSQHMREHNIDAYKTSSNQFLDVHWTISQIVAQHTSNGCNLRPGDLIGSGTISGEDPIASACLMELSEGGKQTFELPGGETRSFLQLGDEVTYVGASKKDGYPRIGFGTCVGRVEAPIVSSDNE